MNTIAYYLKLSYPTSTLINRIFYHLHYVPLNLLIGVCHHLSERLCILDLCLNGPSTLNWTTSLKRSIVKIKKVGGLFMRRERREYSNEFKQQMVDLYLNEKPRSEIIREYDLTPSALDRWINQAKTSGSFEHKDNLTKEQKKMMELEKENKQLKMENDILKQAALIIGRK